MIWVKVNRILHDVVKSFFEGHFTESLELLSTLESVNLTPRDQANLHKTLNLLILGELVGLHNLQQLLEHYGISSRNLYKTWRHFSCQEVVNLCNEIFATVFQHRLLAVAAKSDSTWSRGEVTLVIDSSIYKQVLADSDGYDEYDTFFSGQYKCPVCGFRLTLAGIVISGVFYPIHFYISSKKYSEIQVAVTLIERVAKKLEQLRRQYQISFPNLTLSVDNAFCDKAIDDACAAADIDPIFVPTKTHKLEVDGKITSPKEIIAELKEKEEQGQVDFFPHRIRAVHPKFGPVVLLFFRLTRGKRINVIMTTRLDMKAKTMRRRWFQRTQIEQFFRFSKHILKIQETKAENPDEFVRKAGVNFVKIIVCQTFTQICRKKHKMLKKWSFKKLRAYLMKTMPMPDFLSKILHDHDHLLQSMKLVTC